MYTIEDLAKGKCVLINDGTLDELKEVIKKAFPGDPYIPEGKGIYYYLPNGVGKFWSGTMDKLNLPTQSVKDFLQPQPQFERGEMVMVRDNDNGKWQNRIYIGTFDKLYNKYVCVATGSEQNFKNILYTGIVGWRYIQKIEEEKIVEFTLEQISEKLGVPINLLRIKD